MIIILVHWVPPYPVQGIINSCETKSAEVVHHQYYLGLTNQLLPLKRFLAGPAFFEMLKQQGVSALY